MKFTIAVITPKYKNDYLCDTVLDGLLQLSNEGVLDFFIPSGYQTDLTLDHHIVSNDQFITQAKTRADLIIFCWGKNNTNDELAKHVDRFNKTIFVDGSEVGGNRRYDEEIMRAIEARQYSGQGAINEEYLKLCPVYLRREKPYKDGIRPFPFGIESQYVAQYKSGQSKDLDFVCIFGQEEYPPLRREVREALRVFCRDNGFTCATDKTNTPQDFYALLARAKVGVSVGGGGFDTARFWEVLGNNCLMLTERIDIYPEGSDALSYDRIWQFTNLDSFKEQLEIIGKYLKVQYQYTNLLPEYEAIMARHGSRARVLEILQLSKEQGIL